MLTCALTDPFLWLINSNKATEVQQEKDLAAIEDILKAISQSIFAASAV